MNDFDFIQSLIEYYGQPKNKGMIPVIRGYLRKYIDCNRLAQLRGYIILTHSAINRTNAFPSVKEIEDAVKFAQKEHGVDLRPGKSYQYDHEVLKEEERINDQWLQQNGGFESIFNVPRLSGEKTQQEQWDFDKGAEA